MKHSFLFLSAFLISIAGFAQSRIIEKVIYFQSDSASLTANARAVLDSMVLEINNDSVAAYAIKAIGFADSTGLEEKNLILSKSRAEAVYTYIDTRTRKNKAQEEIKWFGSKDPASSNTLAAGRLLNRRTLLTLELITVQQPDPSNDTLFVEGGAMVIFPPGTLPGNFRDINFACRFLNDVAPCAECEITTMTTDDECLTTGGMLFVNATYQGTSVNDLNGPDSIIVKIPAKDFDPKMGLYTAEQDASGNTVWKPILIVLKKSAEGSYYEFKTRNLGGYNIDRPVIELCRKGTPFKIKTMFNEDKVFVTYNNRNLNSIIAAKRKKPKEHTGTILKSENPNIVSVFKKGQNFYRIQEPAYKLQKRMNKSMYVIRKKHYRKAEQVECPNFDL